MTLLLGGPQAGVLRPPSPLSRVRDLSDAPQYPTAEELFFQTTYETAITTAAVAYVPIFAAPYPLRVRGIACANLAGDLTLDGANYWSFRARRYRVLTNFATEFVDIIGSAGTNFALNVSQKQGQVWSFEPKARYDDTYSQFSTGDLLLLRIASSGAPTSLGNLLVTVRAEPL